MKAYKFTVEALQGRYAVLSNDGAQVRVCVTDPSYHLCLKVAWQMNQLIDQLRKGLALTLDESDVQGPEGGVKALLVPPSPLLPPSDATTAQEALSQLARDADDRGHDKVATILRQEATKIESTTAQKWGAAKQPTDNCPW